MPNLGMASYSCHCAFRAGSQYWEHRMMYHCLWFHRSSVTESIDMHIVHVLGNIMGKNTAKGYFNIFFMSSRNTIKLKESRTSSPRLPILYVRRPFWLKILLPQLLFNTRRHIKLFAPLLLELQSVLPQLPIAHKVVPLERWQRKM